MLCYMKRFWPPTLFAWTMLALAVMFGLCLYVDVSDPCVRYEDRGYTTLGGYLHKDIECVERKSGWRATPLTP